MSETDDVSKGSPMPVEARTADLPPHVQALKAQLQAAEAAAARACGLFQHAPNAAVLVSSNQRILDVNLRLGTLLGLTPDRLIGRRFSHFVAAASQQTLTALLHRSFSEEGTHQAEVQLLLQGGLTPTVRLEVTRGHDPGETPWCHLALTDLTPQAEAHTRLLDEVDALHRQWQDHEVRQRRMDDEVQTVIRASQTQLQEHLARVQNLLKLHHKEVAPQGRPWAHLMRAEDALAETFDLLNSLDQYLHARQLRLKPRRVDLNQVLREVLKEFQGLPQDREMAITSGRLPTVWGDSRALRIILREYLVNALKFTRTRAVARVHVRGEDRDGEAWIGVTDNGVGFSMRYRDKAFELFGRLHPSGVYEGTGIGLATVRHLCDRLGGRVWGEGRVDQGATFWFTCPKPPSTET